MEDEEIIQQRIDALSQQIQNGSKPLGPGNLAGGINAIGDAFGNLVDFVTDNAELLIPDPVESALGEIVRRTLAVSSETARGLSGMLGATSEGAGVVLPGPDPLEATVAPALSEFSEGLPTAQSVLGEMGTVEEFFHSDVPRAFGSAVPFFAAGAAGAAAGLGTKAVTAGLGTLGALAGAGEGVASVREAGAEGTPEGAGRVAAGAALGTLEIVAPLGWLGRLNKASGGTVSKFLKQLFLTGGEEAVTEFVQELGAAGADAAILGKDVNFDEALINAFRAGAAGFVVGGGMSVGGSFAEFNQQTPQEVARSIVEGVRKVAEAPQDQPSIPVQKLDVEQKQTTEAIEDDIISTDNIVKVFKVRSSEAPTTADIPVEELISYVTSAQDNPDLTPKDIKDGAKIVKGELRADKGRLIELLGANMYLGSLPNVVTKELLQNSFDAVKEAVSLGHISRGDIQIAVDERARTIEINDTGVGMSPEIVQKAFFTIAGTKKTGDPSMRSGGFGLAKLAFMMASERITLETTKDGVTTYVTATPEDIVNDNFELVVEKTPGAINGTTVEVKIPESYIDRDTGERRNIQFLPWGGYDIFGFPLVGPVDVSYSENGRPFKTIMSTEELPPLFTTATTDWGTLDIYVAQKERSWARHSVFSSGIYQFNQRFESSSGSIPFDIVVDIKPSVDAASRKYPFNEKREGFQTIIKEDIAALQSYLAALYTNAKNRQAVAEFSTIQELDPTAPQTIQREETTELPPVFSRGPGRITIDNRGVVNFDTGEVLIEKKTEKFGTREKSTFKPGRIIEKLEGPELTTDINKPIFHNSTNIDWQTVDPQAGVFFADVGEVARTVVNDVFAHLEDYATTIPEGKSVRVGVEIQKGISGLNLRDPINSIFINPLASSGKTTGGTANGFLHVVLHEIVHQKVGDEARYGSRFTAEFAELWSRVFDIPGFYGHVLNFERVINKHLSTYTKLREAYNGPDVRNREKTLKGFSVTTPEGGDGGRPGDTRGGVEGTGDAEGAPTGSARSEAYSPEKGRLGDILFGKIRRLFGKGKTEEAPRPAFARQEKPATKQRRFAKQIAEDPRIAPPLAESQQDNNYQPITNPETLAEAQAWIEQQPSLNDAIIKVQDFSSNMSPRVRVTVGSQLIINLNRDYLAERAAGNEVQASQILDKTIALADNIASYGTTLGQGVQAFSMYSQLTPQAFLKKFTDMKRQSVETAFDRDEAIRNQIVEGIQTARNVAVRESLAAPEIQSLTKGITLPDNISQQIELNARIANALSEGDLAMLQDIMQELGVQDIAQASVALRNEYFTRIEKAISKGLTTSLKTILQVPVNTAAQGFNVESQVKNMIRFVQGRMREEGLYSDVAVNGFVREWYEKNILPVTAEEQETIIRMATEMNQRPEGFLRSDAASELMGYMTQRLGVRGQLAELASAQWYSGIFSGVGTNEVNILATASNVFLHAYEMATAMPRSVPALLRGYAEGAKVGLQEFKAAIAGKTTPKAAAKLEIPNILEQFYNPTKPWWSLNNIATIGRYTGRLLRAPDVFWFRTVQEGVAYALVDDYVRRVQGKSKNVPRRPVREYVAQMLFNTETDAAAFEAIARLELEAAGRLKNKEGKVNRRDLDRRIFELMLEKRREVPGGTKRERIAIRQAERATFTLEPEGLLAGFSAAATTAVRKTVINTPIGVARVLTPVIPVVRIMANVGDVLLDFSPVGVLRGVRGGRTFGEGKRFDPIEARGRLWKGIAGTMFIPLLASLTATFGEENEDENNGFIFDITGQGPRDFQQRRQWREQGNKEWSVRIKIPGVVDIHTGYIEQPFALPFMLIGAFRDTKKHEKVNPDSAFEIASFSAFVVSSAFLDQQFVRGVADALEVVEGKRDPLSYLASPLGGFVPPYFSALFRDLSNITDPVMRDPDSIGFVGQLLKNTPFLKSVSGRPAINVLGEVVKKDALERNPFTRRFFSLRTKDPVWQWLAKNKLFVPDPRRSKEITVMVGNLSKKDQPLFRALYDKRRAKVGAVVAGVLTEEEAYDFVKFRGEIIKLNLERLIKNGAFEQVRKEAIDQAIAQGFTKTEAELFGHSAINRALQDISVDAGNIAKRQILGLPLTSIPTSKFELQLRRRIRPRINTP